MCWAALSHQLDSGNWYNLHILRTNGAHKNPTTFRDIIATNASVEGESTALILQRYIQEAGLNTTITRLARVYSNGVDLEQCRPNYTDSMHCSCPETVIDSTASSTLENTRHPAGTSLLY